MIILGADPATVKFGWSLVCDGVRLASGTWHLTDRGSDFPQRMRLLYEHLVDIDNTACGPVDLVVVERPFSHHTGSLVKQAKTLGIIDLFAGRRQRELIEVSPGDLKEWATGSCRASKGAMEEACKRRAKWVASDDNEADAVLLALYGWHQKMAEAAG